MPKYCSARHCIRDLLKDCLESEMGKAVSVSCGRYDCFKLEDLHGQGKCAITISTPNQTAVAASRSINEGGQPFIGQNEPGTCKSNQCLQTDQMTLQVRLQVYAVDCGDALQRAEECAAWAAGLFCKHQCQLPVEKIRWDSSQTTGTSQGESNLVVVTENYSITYSYNHCTGKIKLARC